MHIPLKSNRPESKMTYDKVCENLDNIIDVDNNDINNSHQLLDKIKNHIKSVDILYAISHQIGY